MASPQHLVGTADLNLIEAPVTWRAYMICGFASFGGSLDHRPQDTCKMQRLILFSLHRYPLRL
jgi:hypothetical protein